METHGFGEKKCVADAIDKSTDFRLCGTFETCRDTRVESAFGAEPDLTIATAEV
jgi:hypothetical protein